MVVIKIPQLSLPRPSILDWYVLKQGLWISALSAAALLGLFYIATFAFSIPALGFYDSAINDSNWVRGAGSHSGVAWGGFFVSG